MMLAALVAVLSEAASWLIVTLITGAPSSA